jgi:plastocyanin
VAPPKLDVQRGVWVVVVAAFLALAAGAPVEMLQFRADRNAAKRASAAGPGSAKVTMVSLTFQPAQLAVRKGTEVVFENDDVAPHTVTAATGGAFDSGTLNSRKVFKLVVNDTIEYVCLIHPSMKGKIVLTG